MCNGKNLEPGKLLLKQYGDNIHNQYQNIMQDDVHTPIFRKEYNKQMTYMARNAKDIRISFHIRLA